MRRTLVLPLVILGACVVGVVPAAAESVPPAPTVSWPGWGPVCPERAPVGAVFVKRVQPPFGLGYDLWRISSGDLLPIYC